MTNLSPTTAEERYEMRADVLGGDRLTCDECLRLLADIQRLEAVAEAAKRLMRRDESTDPDGRCYSCSQRVVSYRDDDHTQHAPSCPWAALRQALAEAGK